MGTALTSPSGELLGNGIPSVGAPARFRLAQETESRFPSAWNINFPTDEKRCPSDLNSQTTGMAMCVRGE